MKKEGINQGTFCELVYVFFYVDLCPVKCPSNKSHKQPQKKQFSKIFYRTFPPFV